MSEWIDITDKDDVELSRDGTEIEVLFETNKFGNRYINIPVEFIRGVLDDWISVTERLPQENIPVLVYVKENNGDSGEDYYSIDAVEDGLWISIMDYEEQASITAVPAWTIYSRPEVTHWMPLPEPPKTQIGATDL